MCALTPIMKTTRNTCIHSERRSGSSSAGDHLRIAAALVERHIQQTLDFLIGRERAPLGVEEAGSWVGEAREGDDAAIVAADAELALALERGACHRLGYVAGSGSGRKHA